MKDRYLCLIFLYTFSVATVQAQNPADIFENTDNPLYNTFWVLSLENASNSLIAYFSQDTAYRADDLEAEYIPGFKYKIVGDTFFVQAIEFAFSFCDTSIVGKYIYTIEEDVLRLSLFEDDCYIREEGFPEDIYTRIDYVFPTIEEEESPKDTLGERYVFYPNPNPDGIFYYQNNWIDRPEYRLYDVHGNLLRSGIIRSSGEIRLNQYEGNLFFLTILGVYGWETYRLLR